MFNNNCELELVKGSNFNIEYTKKDLSENVEDKVVEPNKVRKYTWCNEKLEMVEEFLKGYVRETHYGSYKTTLERLGLIKTFEEKISKEDLEKELCRLTTNCPIMPARIFVYENELHLDFYPRTYTILETVIDYMNLCIDFIDYKNECGLKDYIFSVGSLDDCPETFTEEAVVKAGLEFTEEHFKSDKIEIWGDIEANV